jgi:hypothetical protein
MKTHGYRFDAELEVGAAFLDEVLANPPLLPWGEFWLNTPPVAGQRLPDALVAGRVERASSDRGA